MVRREVSRRVSHALLPRRVVHRVEPGDVSIAPPGRGGVEALLLRHLLAELALQHLTPPGGVAEPAGRRFVPLASTLPDHGVRSGGVNRQVGHLRSELDLDPEGAVHGDEIALERRALELEARVEGEVIGADLAHLRERHVLLGRIEEEAEAVLEELVLIKIRAELKAPDHVARRHFDRALADLVVFDRLGGLEDQDRELGAR